MSDGANKEGAIVTALKDVYRGGPVDEYWESPSDLSPEDRLKDFESGPTCGSSYFCREPNLRVLAEEIISKEKEKDWQILCVGCGKGPEPYELAMRLLQGGQKNFKIDAFDVSKKAIAEAQKGEIIHDGDWGDSDMGDFLQRMEEASLVRRIESPVGPKKERRWFRKRQPASPTTINYSLDESVRSRMNFFTHDIIEEPFRRQEQYDVIVCNTVLQHYPPWTRELILTHILESLKDDGILALEENESLDLWGMDARRARERYVWLRPYYDWKEDLSRFGLAPEKVGSEEITFYHYEVNKNQYKGKELAIRDRKLVEVPGG